MNTKDLKRSLTKALADRICARLQGIFKVGKHGFEESTMEQINLNIDRWKDVWLAKGISINKVPDSWFHEVNGVRGFLSPGDIEYLWNVAGRIPKAGKYLEIGSWMGLSSIVVANSLLANLNFDARVYCVDTWEGSPEHQEMEEIKNKQVFDIFSENVAKSKMEHFIVPTRGPSLEMVHRFADRSLDAIFVDGDHSFEGCLADMEAWWPKLKPGGHFFGHDAVPGSGPEKAVQAFASKYGVEFTIIRSPKAFHIWEILP